MEETQKSELKKKIQKDNSTEKIYPEEKENQESEKIEKDDSLANNDIPEKKDVEMIEKPKAQKPGSELFERIEMPDIKKLEIKPENEVLEETKVMIYIDF